MKRLLLIFLLTVLPLQMSWAAVTNYCQHENGKAAQHFGHHEHKHQATSDDTLKLKSSLTVDTDCGVCQLSSAALPSASSDVAPISARQAGPSPIKADLISSVRPERPERPKWARAV